MRKTRRNRTPKAERKNDYPVLRKYRGRSYDNAVCKNAEFVEETVKDFSIKFKKNVGCKNLRADGSSHCSKCSKKHNAKK